MQDADALSDRGFVQDAGCRWAKVIEVLLKMPDTECSLAKTKIDLLFRKSELNM